MTKKYTPQTPKLVYTVLILKKNQDHIAAIETDNYDQAYELWKSLVESWRACVKNQEPFSIESPIVTAFDPGLVLEISLVPITQTVEVNNNPYKKEMVEKGLSETLGRYNTRGAEILDGGLKL